MQTEGTMKVIVFETPSTDVPTAVAVGKLFSEAAEWFRWESIRDIDIGPKKTGRRNFMNVSLSLRELTEFEDREESPASTMQLFIHFDDNEYKK